jgi:carboxyl-terminal processing protease
MKTALSTFSKRLLLLGGFLLTGFAAAATAEIPLNQAPQGETIGIGVALGLDDATKMPKIVKVFPGSTAAKAGLAEGDLIREINGATTTGLKLEQCVQMIRGPEGTTVLLEIIPIKEGTSIQVELKRLPFRLTN